MQFGNRCGIGIFVWPLSNWNKQNLANIQSLAMWVERFVRVTVKTGWTLPQAHILLASGGFGSGVRSSSGVGRSSMAAADASIMATEGESVHECKFEYSMGWSEQNSFWEWLDLPRCVLLYEYSSCNKICQIRKGTVGCEYARRKINWNCHELSMLLRNNGPANPKCNNISAVCKSVNAKKKYASATSLCLGEQDAKTKRKSPQSAAAP